jgi:hypothetical protein
MFFVACEPVVIVQRIHKEVNYVFPRQKGTRDTKAWHEKEDQLKKLKEEAKDSSYMIC